MRRRTALSVAGALTVLGTLVGLGTYAAWDTGAGTPALGRLQAGSFTEVTDSVRWRVTNSAFADGFDASRHLVSGGEQVEVHRGSTVRLEGDNLAVRATVRWSRPVSLPAGVTATYRLTHDGAPLADQVPVGEPVTVTVPVSTSGKDATLDLAVSLRFPDPLPASFEDAPPATDLGRLVYQLDQVRPGGDR